jgi:NAD(P)-dependent dehydrogenase (short-subunit alcohol dehydrogenase family)
MIAETMRRNPAGRMTQPADVAATIMALSQPAVQFVSGSVIFVDGGEDVIG